MTSNARKAKIEPIHVEESEALKRLFQKHASLSQSAFGAEYEIGTQGMVWQYLNAKSPLNAQAAVKFAKGLGVDVRDFSPRLADEIEALAGDRPVQDGPANTGAEARSQKQAGINNEKSDQPARWPFSAISEAEVRALPEAARNRLDGALALAIAQMNLRGTPASAPVLGGPIADPDSADNPFPPPAFVEPKPWAVGLPLGSTVKQAPQLQISTQTDVGHLANAGYSANDHQFLAVPELDVRLAAGALGIENYSETQIGEILLRKSFLESFGLPLDRMKIVYGEGDSMEPVIRHRAPMLFFEEAITDRRLINQRMVYAINRGGKMLVKCLARDMSGAWVARSLNPAYPDFPLEADDGSEVRIVGRILWSPYDLRNGVDERLVRR